MPEFNKILIVDDSLVMRMKIKDVLVKDGFEVIGMAKNGREGFELYKKLQPDLVTMDIIMPEMIGVESLKLIRGHDPKAKVVMVTSLHQAKLLKESLDAGARDYIVKPFSEDELLNSIRKISTEEAS